LQSASWCSLRLPTPPCPCPWIILPSNPWAHKRNISLLDSSSLPSGRDTWQSTKNTRQTLCWVPHSANCARFAKCQRADTRQTVHTLPSVSSLTLGKVCSQACHVWSVCRVSWSWHSANWPESIFFCLFHLRHNAQV
jgi:hypothetical protein